MKKQIKVTNKHYVVLNEQHTLLPEQVDILTLTYGKDWELYLVPSSGWSSKDMLDESGKIFQDLVTAKIVVFASPVPILIKAMCINRWGATLIFHNDNREKKELPNGKVISVTAKTGWQLL